MKALKEHMSPIAFALFELIVGILLLINPVGFTVGIIAAAGVVLMICGLIGVVRYFRMDAKAASVGQTLAQALAVMLVGIFCTFRSEWFIATFPMLTMLYGVCILFTGMSKIQMAVDMLRQKNKKWFWAAINAAFSILCAVIILNSPFATAAILWMFTGISLIVEAALDVITLVMGSREEAHKE